MSLINEKQLFTSGEKKYVSIEKKYIVFIKRIIKIKVNIIIRYGTLKIFFLNFYAIMKKIIKNYI